MDKIIKTPFLIAGSTLAFGITGKAFNSEGLTSAGETTSKFIGPAVNISIGGLVINKLRKMKGGLK